MSNNNFFLTEANVAYDVFASTALLSLSLFELLSSPWV